MRKPFVPVDGLTSAANSTRGRSRSLRKAARVSADSAALATQTEPTQRRTNSSKNEVTDEEFR